MCASVCRLHASLKCGHHALPLCVSPQTAAAEASEIKAWPELTEPQNEDKIQLCYL